MNRRHLIISGCGECPHFNNYYYTYNETCDILNVLIPGVNYGMDGPEYPIPDNCPLEVAE